MTTVAMRLRGSWRGSLHVVDITLDTPTVRLSLNAVILKAWRSMGSMSCRSMLDDLSRDQVLLRGDNGVWNMV